MTPTDPVYIALTTMRGWMNAFIQTSRIDPERTSITFRGPDQLATCCKLQEVLDIADKALAHAEAREPVALVTVLTPEEAKAAGRAAHVRRRDRAGIRLSEDERRYMVPTIEDAARFIEAHEIVDSNEGQTVRPRSEGNRAGLAYAAALREAYR